MDQGMEMLREANAAFGNYTHPSPGVPEIDIKGKVKLFAYGRRLAALAQEIKEDAAVDRGLGRDMVALLLIRLQLSVEETGEWAEALASGDINQAAQELVDMSYVTDGHYLTLGLGEAKLALFREVHDANMSKLVDCEACASTGTRQPEGVPCDNCKGLGRHAVISEAGRWVKGPGYRKPDIAFVLGEIAEAKDD